MIRIGREALRCLLARRGITFQRTKTWKESPDPEPDAKLDRIEEVLERFADRVFAFDEFGPLGIRPNRRGRLSSRRSPRAPSRDLPSHPRGAVLPRLLFRRRRPAVGRQPPQEGCSEHPGRTDVDPGRAPGRRPDLRHPGHLSAHKGDKIRRWAKKNRVELCFTRPTPPGPTRSKPISGHRGSSRSPTPTTATTACRPGPCTLTCAGRTTTPATPTSSRRSVANVPAPEARRASAGADVPCRRNLNDLTNPCGRGPNVQQSTGQTNHSRTQPEAGEASIALRMRCSSTRSWGVTLANLRSYSAARAASARSRACVPSAVSTSR